MGVPLRLPCDNFDGESKYSGQKVEAAHSALLGIHHNALGSDGTSPNLPMLGVSDIRIPHSGKRHRPDEARLKGERLGPHPRHRSWNLSPALSLAGCSSGSSLEMEAQRALIR